MSSLTVLIVDDEASTRTGLRMLLQFETDIEVVGEAHNGLSALQLIEQLEPDLVLMDVRMPGMDGITCAREIARRFPHVSVLFLSLYDDQGSRASAAETGAIGFIPKHSMTEKLLPALHELLSLK